MQKIQEKLKRVVESKILVQTIKILGVAIIVVLIFSAGVTVGFHKASFGRSWGEHYGENFGWGLREDHRGDVYRAGLVNYFPNAHGAVGKIIKKELPNIIVQDKTNIEKVVFLGSDTKIEEGGEEIPQTDLEIDEFVVVIGTPNPQGIIEAKLIRVIPNPEFLK